MKKSYKITLIVIGVLVIFLLVAGHLAPMIFYSVVIKPKASQTINISPTFMSQALKPLDDWEKAEFGDFTFTLPLSKLKSAKSTLDTSMLFFQFNEWHLTVHSLVLSDIEKTIYAKGKMPSFSEMLTIYCVKANDLSLFRSPIANYNILSRLIVKGMLPALNKIIVFETPDTKSILLESVNPNMVLCSVYFENPKRNIEVDLFSKHVLRVEEVLKLIGSIEISKTPTGADKYYSDLQQFQNKYGISFDVIKCSKTANQ